MSDNGEYLEGYASSWIPDTDLVRKRILKKLQNWSPYSNSSPSEGLERALRFHKDKFVPFMFWETILLVHRKDRLFRGLIN